MNKNPKLIYNPTAAQGNAGKMLSKVQDLLSEQGFTYDLVLTEYPGHALHLARQAAEDGYDLIVATGGDGTINETINGIMLAQCDGRSRPALGVLPVGRGNDFAYGVGIPMDIIQARDLLVKGKRRRIDIGLVKGGDFPDGRYFGNGVGLGFDTVVGFEAAKITWLHGAASYLVALVKTIFLYAHAPIYEVVLDGQTLQQPFLMVSIMNGRRMGGSFMMAPDGDPRDGTFNLCLAGDVKQIRILPVAIKFMSGKQEEDPDVMMARSRKVSVRAIQGSIPAHADGETICTTGQMLSIELLPNALDVIA